MEDYLNGKSLCHVCGEEQTTIHAEIAQGQHVYVCEKCLESAKQNFIWICMNCGNAYIRPKSLVLKRLQEGPVKQAFTQCESLQIIQGIDFCIECSPQDVLACVCAAKNDKGWHC